MTATLKNVYATLPHTQRARGMVLNGDPKGNNFLYCNGKHVIIRDINNPGIAETYSQHSVEATVAQYSPSGYYIASGDVSGKVRIWDTVNKEHILKFEAQPFAGPIRDLCWDAESKRIAVGGEGREVMAAVFIWDSGSTLGKIIGHSKQVNSIAFKHSRPFRIATASEDYTANFLEGPPFKHKCTLREHTNFINCVRFSPSGSQFCTVSSDKTAFLYDGKTGEMIGSLGGGDSTAHKGGIYSVCWSPDGSQVVTASADKTCKLWDVATQQEVSCFNMGTTLHDQQLGCIWQGDHILTCSLSGNISYLDRNNPDKPLRIIEGQNKNLTSVCASGNGSHIFCGSNDGRISYWNTDSGDVSIIKGGGHTSLVCSLVASEENLYSLGLDKAMRQTPLSAFEFSSDAVSFPDRDAKCLARSPDGLIAVATLTDVSLVRDGKVVHTLSIPEEPYTACFNPAKPELAIGTKNAKVIIYSTENDSLNQTKVITLRDQDEVNTIDYSSSGELLAVGGSFKNVVVYNAETCQIVVTLVKHAARVTAIKFSPDGKYIISCGIDTNICIHDIEKKHSEVIKGAHPLSVINGITWVNDNTFASCGDDCCIRVWEMTR